MYSSIMNTIKRLKLSVQQHYEHNKEAKKLRVQQHYEHNKEAKKLSVQQHYEHNKEAKVECTAAL